MQNPAHTLCFVILASVFQRAKGLLGSQRNAGPVALVPCASVHTFGMRYDLDIAFVTKDGVVMRSERSVPSGKVLVAFGAYYALERPSSEDPWPECGERMSIKEVPPSARR